MTGVYIAVGLLLLFAIPDPRCSPTNAQEAWFEEEIYTEII